MLRNICGVLLAVIVLCFPCLAFSETVTFRYLPLEAGTVVLESNKFLITQDLTITVNEETKSATWEDLIHDLIRKTVLEVKDGVPTKVEVHYITSREEVSASVGEKQSTVQPVEGKTYVVSVTDGAITIVDESGETPQEDEAALVWRQFRTIVEDPLSKFLDGKQFSLGQPVDIPGEVAKRIFVKEEVKKFSLSLLGVTEINGARCGRFEMVLELLREPEQGMKTSMDLKGEALIELDTARSIMTDLKGPIGVTVVRPEQNMEILGSGSVDMVIKVDYSQKDN